MSAAKPFPRSVASYVELFDEVMLWSQMHAPTGDWNKLWRRLDAISLRVRDDAAGRTSAPNWAYRLEHGVLIEVLGETLLPAVLDDLVETLRSQRGRGETDPGVWAALDRKPFEEARDRIRRHASSAEAGMFAALNQLSKKPSQVRLEGLRALGALHDARVALAPVFETKVLVGEARHLAEALCNLMPPTATRLLSSAVEIGFRSELEGAPINELGPARPFWHHKLPGLGIWYPVWQGLRFGADQPDLFGTWFVPWLQTIYEERHGRAEAERASKRNEEQRQLRAAEIERERQIREDADERAKEARLREEHARRRQADVEAAQERVRVERCQAPTA